MRIYIASSWKNQLAVELLTAELRRRQHEVISFVEQALTSTEELVFDNPDWIWSDEGKAKFQFDLDGATKSDLVIYIAPSGKDAWAEVGAAYASGVRVIGFYAKGEGSGLAQRMMAHWYTDIKSLLHDVATQQEDIDNG